MTKLALILVAWSLWPISSSANILFQEDIETVLMDPLLQDENGKDYRLHDLVAQHQGLSLLMPMFSKCKTICPLMMQQAKKVVKGRPDLEGSYQIIVLSFAAEDPPQALKTFRLQQQLPSEWKLVKVKQTEHSFFKQLKYPIMQLEGGEYSHQGILFALGQDSSLLASIPSQSFDAYDLSILTRFYDLLSYSPKMTLWMHKVLHPEHLAIYGFIVLIVCMFLIFIALMSLGHKKKASYQADSLTT